ncbi:MAG: ribbon-helix-helix domain-containing protein [Verrucomicrobiae bacterium]|nr:ribbon-helix-helix domain-containing protein [Verrucomicrobiae bacterium]MDW8308033.1 ribbon-helix-helix domain-containing protein [Verrucomicrobiales bacterium]
MKTVSKTISLAPELLRFAEQKARQGGYGSVSEFLADLLRRDRAAAERELAEEFRRLSADGAPGAEPVARVVSAVRRARKAGQSQQR